MPELLFPQLLSGTDNRTATPQRLNCKAGLQSKPNEPGDELQVEVSRGYKRAGQELMGWEEYWEQDRTMTTSMLLGLRRL